MGTVVGANSPALLEFNKKPLTNPVLLTDHVFVCQDVKLEEFFKMVKDHNMQVTNFVTTSGHVVVGCVADKKIAAVNDNFKITNF